MKAAEALADVLGSINGLRSYPLLPDQFSPPGVVVGQPTFDYQTAPEVPCSLQMEVPGYLTVARSSDRQAQVQLLDFVEAIDGVLDKDETLGGRVVHAALLRATPATVSTSGQDLPSYELSFRLLVQ